MYKLIIFDVDGTFYDLNDVVSDNYNMQVNFFAQEKGMLPNTVSELFQANHIFPYKSEHARSATEFFLHSGVEPEKWRQYRDTHSFTKHICRETAVSNDLLQQYAKLAKLVLLSSNTMGNIVQILNWLKIDINLFKDVFCSAIELEGQPFSKMNVIPYILSRYQLDPEQVLAIGDRYQTDIKPLIELGGNGVLIHQPEELQQVLRDIQMGVLGESSSSTYMFYRKAGVK